MPTNNAYYITTAIPFVNARPHIGFALECVLSDALARYHRQQGREVRFLSGTDENSLKNVQAAECEGISTETLVARNAASFAALREQLNLSYDDFIRTSVERRHRSGVVRLWRACLRNGDIYKRSYRGLYCVGCEQFYTDAELIDGLCPEHLRAPEPVEEENYFFRLSRYQARLLELIESGSLRIVPDKRRNEVLSFIRSGLEDFSISRSRARARGWGIPVPDDPGQVIYVWFDALGNYITALGYAEQAANYHKYWVDADERVHVIGKGITRFHAVYWPALLLSAGATLPTSILVHGYLTAEGKKIGKSLGNTVDPHELVKSFGSDALRYYLLRYIRSGEDGDFSLARLQQAYNSDLADQLGNLLKRSLRLVDLYCAGIVPAPGTPRIEDRALIESAGVLSRSVAHAVERFQLHDALAAIWQFIVQTNRYINQTAPWRIARHSANEEQHARLASVLYNLIEALRLIAYHCQPFLPETSVKIAEQIGLEPNTASVWGGYPPGTKIQPGEVLFAKSANQDLASDALCAETR